MMARKLRLHIPNIDVIDAGKVIIIYHFIFPDKTTLYLITV